MNYFIYTSHNDYYYDYYDCYDDDDDADYHFVIIKTLHGVKIVFLFHMENRKGDNKAHS